MYFTGFSDEAVMTRGVEGHIKATLELGWRNIEARNMCIREKASNFTMLNDEDFNEASEKLAEAGISVNCFGSAVANGSRKITEPPDDSYEEMRRAIPRMHQLGTKMIRIMSFGIPAEVRDRDWSKEAISRVRTIARMAEDGGVICVHENCAGWGGISSENTLRLLEEVNSPALKLVFDTGNPIGSAEGAWDFYRAVRDHVVYIHIKDGVRGPDGSKTYTFPGEGEGRVRDILADLFRNGYDGGISIEPHMRLDDKAPRPDESIEEKEERRRNNYVEYGRRLEKIVEEIKSGM